MWPFKKHTYRWEEVQRGWIYVREDGRVCGEAWYGPIWSWAKSGLRGTEKPFRTLEMAKQYVEETYGK